MTRVKRLMYLGLLAATVSSASAQLIDGGAGSLGRSRARPVSGSIILRGPTNPAVRVTVESQNRTVNTVVFSDGSGSFFVSNLPFGAYSVLLEAPGYLSQRETIDVPPGSGPVAVQFMMQAEPPPNTGGSNEGFVSVASLKVSDEAKREYAAGIKEAQRQRFADARKHFELALEKEPHFPAALYALARMDLDEGKVDTAIEKLHQAVGIDASFEPAQFSLAMALNQVGQHEPALKAAEKAVSLRPGAWHAYFELGFAALAMGNETRALQCSEKIVSLAGAEVPEAYLLRAGVLLRRSQLREARVQLQEFLRRAPNHRRSPMVRSTLLQVEQQLTSSMPSQ
jgi:tetratricopeptide (TPR) repeat protein